jgi:hypothetical protein
MSTTRRSALCVLVAACGGGSGGHPDAIIDAAAHDAISDGAPALAFADLRVTWTILDLAGLPVACPTGYPTAVLIATPTDGAPRTLEQLACDQGSGVGTFELGSYAFEMDVANMIDAEVAASSAPVTIELTADAAYAFIMRTGGSPYTFRWQLVGGTSGDALTCDQAGVSAIGVTAISTDGGSGGNAQSFPCAAGSATSAPIAADTYYFAVTADGVTPASDTTSFTIGIGGRPVQLGTVTVIVAGK